MTYMAPDGTPIQGEHNTDFCAFPVSWRDGAGVDEPYYSDAPDVEWGGTVYDNCVVWLDEDFGEWLAHHLIPQGNATVGDAGIAAAEYETGCRKRVWLLRQVADTLEPDEPMRAIVEQIVEYQHAAAAGFRLQFEEAKLESVGPADHAAFPVEDWQYEVANGDTTRGYEDWLEAKRDA